MNRIKLKQAEQRFLTQYPGGFEHPEMLEISKKHKVDKMRKLAEDSFEIEEFENLSNIFKSMGNIVAKSSLVSIFEKFHFRDLIKILREEEKESLADGLKEFLHGDQEYGFEQMIGLLNQYKLAKWPLLTIYGVYYDPSFEVLIKPTTVKGIINYFELEGIQYNPKPSYAFYKAYREQINLMKKDMHPSLQVDNAAFSGFLMISMENDVNHH